MPSPTEQPVLHALGRITTIAADGRHVTVRFAPIAANPSFLQNRQITFLLDTAARNRFLALDWVVANWNRNPKKDKASGALQVQGSFAGGTHLVPVTSAAHDPQHTDWMTKAAHQLEAWSKTDGPVSGPDLKQGPNPFREQAGATDSAPPAIAQVMQTLQRSDGSVAGEDPPKAWLPTPVPMPQLVAELFYPDGYVRLGYVSFNLDSPTEEIRISQTATDHRIETLRSRSPILKDNQHNQVQVSMSLTLADNDAINGVLLPLVRLFRRSPFLPVQNQLLQEAGVDALTLRQLSIATMPGFPNGLRAELVCSQFSWQPYMPAAQSLDDQFCYPLLKLWMERPVSNLPAHTPLSPHWNGAFRMYHPDERWLSQVSEYSATADRATRINHDVDLIRQALEWQQNPYRAKLNGFTLSPTPTAFDTQKSSLGRVAEDNLPVMELTEDIGHAIYHGEEIVFLKLRSEEAVRALVANDADTVEIFQDGVRIRVLMKDGKQADGYRPGSQGTMTPGRMRVHLGDPQRDPGIPNPADMDPGSAGTRATLADGKRFTFLVRASDPVLKRLLTNGILKPPDAPQDPQDPLADVANAFAPTDLVIEQISCALSNRIAELQLRGQTSASHQFMGSQAVEWNLAGTIAHNRHGNGSDHGADIAQIQGFFDRVQELGRKYMGRANGSPFGGFVIIENELFQMMGVRHALPIAWHFETIPSFPNALRFEMTLIEFDITQRRREIIQDMMGDLPQKAKSLELLTLTDSLRGSYLSTEETNRRLRAIELYPDMALPTHAELSEWVQAIQEDRVWDWAGDRPFPEFYWLDPSEGGTGWNWTVAENSPRLEADTVGLLPEAFLRLKAPPAAPARFAEPDFYCAPAGIFQHEFVENVLKQTLGQQIKMTDPYGALSLHQVGEVLKEHHVHDPQDTIKTSQQKIDEGAHPLPKGASARPIDKIMNNPTGAAGPPLPNDPHAKPGVAPPADQPAVGSIPQDDSGTASDRYHRYAGAAAYFAQKYKIPQDLFFAQIEQESGGRRNGWKSSADSGKAKGLVQFIPGTWAEVSKKLGFPGVSPHDPVANLHAAAYYLRQQLNAVGGNETLALAAYNAGLGAVQKYGMRVPPYPETQAYVKIIMQNRTTYQAGRFSPSMQAYQLDQEEIDRNAERLKLLFNRGYGYKLDDLRKYIIDPRGTNELQFEEKPLRGDGGEVGAKDEWWNIPGWTQRMVAGTVNHIVPAAARARREREDTRQQWIPLQWLYGIDGDTPTTQRDGEGYREAGGDGRWGDYFQVKAQFLPIFLKRLRERKLHLEPVHIPHRLPGKYATQEAVTQSSKHYNDIREVFYHPDGHDMFHDARESMTMGRLLGAFPTFYVALLDGGRWLRVWKLYDHIYGMMAVTQIAVHRTRKSPVDTATVTFGNMFGHLTAATYDLAKEAANDTRGVWTLEALSRGLQGYLEPDEELLSVWAQQRNSLMLKPGARLHIRLGYGSDASQLPIAFNGVISEVPVEEGVVSVVALSDGVELINDLAPNGLQGSTPVYRLNAFLGEGANPAELIKSFMAPTNATDAVSTFAGQFLHPFFYYSFRNPYGIEHFGQGIRRGLAFDIGEIGVNIFNPESSVPYNSSSAWDNTLRIFQVQKWETVTKLIGVNVTDATPWAVMEVCRKCVPDYILAVHPFGFRSTLFYGKGWFPLFYQYRTPRKGELIAYSDDLISEAVMDQKPFQQFHVVNSAYNMLANMVRADGSEVVTRVQAVGTYNGVLPGSLDLSNEASYIMELDQYIYDEHQKMKVVQSGLYTTVGMKLADANSDQGGAIRVGLGALALLTGIGEAAALPAILSGYLKAFTRSRRVEDYAAAMVLKDHVKEMYQGEFLLFGNGYMKPYDIIAISDSLSQLNGMAEVRQVIHTLSVETGFVTAVTPDCIANFIDYEGRDLLLWLYYAANNFLLSFGLMATLGALSRRVTPFFLLQGAKNFRKWTELQLRKARATGKSEIKELGVSVAELRDTVDQLRAKERRLSQALKTKNGAQALTYLRELTETEPFKKLFEQAPGWIKTQVITQKVLRGLPGASSVSKAKDWAGGMAGKAGTRYAAAAKKLETARAEARTGLSEAQAELEAKAGALGRTKVNRWIELERQTRRRLRPGQELAAIEKIAVQEDREGVMLVKQLYKAKKALWFATSKAEAAAVPDLARMAVGRVVGQSIAKELLVTVAGAALFDCVIGSLSDWLTRWAVARQCLTVFPLRIKDREFSAGINGHRGSVPGDRLIGLSAALQGLSEAVSHNPWVTVIPVIGDLLSAVAVRPEESKQPYPTLVPPDP